LVTLVSLEIKERSFQMVVQNNPTPWIGLALFTAVLCGIVGLILGLDPFGPGQEMRAEAAQTRLAVSVRMTENAIGASETPQAVTVAQTVQAAQLTAMPNQQTATLVSGEWALAGARIDATQTAVADQALIGQAIAEATKTSLAQSVQLSQMAGEATGTAIAESLVRERAAGLSGLGALILGTLLISGWLVARTLTVVMAARAREKDAQAKLLAEQRRLLSLRDSIRKQREERNQPYPVPTSLMRKSNDVQDLPRAE
jgi:hypothetical protein